jgi:hypothetical protein
VIRSVLVVSPELTMEEAKVRGNDPQRRLSAFRARTAEMSVGLCSLPAPSPPLSVPRLIQVVLDRKEVTRPSALVVFAVFFPNRTYRGPHSLDRPLS